MISKPLTQKEETSSRTAQEQIEIMNRNTARMAQIMLARYPKSSDLAKKARKILSEIPPNMPRFAVEGYMSDIYKICSDAIETIIKEAIHTGDYEYEQELETLFEKDKSIQKGILHEYLSLVFATTQTSKTEEEPAKLTPTETAKKEPFIAEATETYTPNESEKPTTSWRAKIKGLFTRSK